MSEQGFPATRSMRLRVSLIPVGTLLFILFWFIVSSGMMFSSCSQCSPYIEYGSTDMAWASLFAALLLFIIVPLLIAMAIVPLVSLSVKEMGSLAKLAAFITVLTGGVLVLYGSFVVWGLANLSRSVSPVPSVFLLLFAAAVLVYGVVTTVSCGKRVKIRMRYLPEHEYVLRRLTA